MNLAEARATVGEKSPVFDAPPVVETALGVRFAPIEGFNVVHFGQLLSSYNDVYNRFELKPPVVGTVQFNIGQDSANINIPLRCWYINQDDTQLVQVQHDMFVRNWRATANNSEYQHYDRIKPLFNRDWMRFCQFLDDHKLRRPVVWQCEVTYINHLLRGREWRTFDDIPSLFPVWKGLEPGGVFGTIDMAALTMAFRLPDGSSRIQFTLQPAIRQDGAEILQLTVAAQGPPERYDDSAILEWLDYGHLAVVNGFVQFVSSDALKIWGHK